MLYNLNIVVHISVEHMISDIKIDKINLNSKVPKYCQVKDVLFKTVKSLPPDDALLSECQLAEHFNVHRFTVRQAISELVKEGILYRIHGKGTFVSGSKQKKNFSQERNIACYFRNVRAKRDDDNFFLEIFEAIENEIGKHGLYMLYKKMSDEKDGNVSAINSLAASGVRGLLLDERITDDMICRMELSDIPAIVVNRKTGIEGAGSVSFNNKDASLKALEHVLEMGHKKILFVYKNTDPNQLERAEGFLEACRKLKVPIENILLKGACEFDLSGRMYRKAIKEGLEELKPGAVISAFDWIAVNVYAVASEMGLKIPSDLSVLSIGDITLAQNMTPPLTTVKLDTYAMGKEAAKMLIEENKNIRSIEIPVTLIRRGSCVKRGN